MENISQTAKVLKRKAEVVPDLEEGYHEALARYEEAEKAREQRHKADELKKELAWAHVAAKEAVRMHQPCSLKRMLINYSVGIGGKDEGSGVDTTQG